MPIEGLSDLRRLSRDFKIRLGGRLIKGEDGGVREPKYDDKTHQREQGGYPKESESFVMLPDDVPEDVRDLYGPEPTSLRMMLPFEWDAVDPLTQDELVFNRYNRAYGQLHGLKCKGTGNNAEQPGMATVTDEAWANRIAEKTGQAKEPDPLRGPTAYNVVCLGQDCPKYLRTVTEEYQRQGGGKGWRTVKAPGLDPDAACKRMFILRAFLLHTTRDTTSPNYCRVLGVAEIASSSFNTMINLQSDFTRLRGFAGGESAGLPFTLDRKPFTSFKPARAVHYALRASWDYAEVARWGAIPLQERFLSDEVRSRLRQIAALPLAPSWDSVRDLLPEHLLEGATAAATGAGVPTPTEPGSNPPGAPQSAEEGAAGEPLGEGGDRKLLKGELDELKGLCGGRIYPDAPAGIENPWRPEALDRLREIVTLYNSKHGTEYSRFTDLTFDVYTFVKDYLSKVLG